VPVGATRSPPPNTPPTANFASSCTGLVCRFTNLSSDGDGQVTAYTWDFGDGGVAASKDAQHTYSAASTYRVKLTVTDDDGTSSDVTETIETRGPVNARPTANFTSSCTDLDCSFTDLSSDGDGTVIGFHWDFGDGVIAATRNSTHPYASAGTYVVELTVTDNSGATGNLSHQLTVTSPPTGAMIGLSQTSFYFCTPPGGSTRVCGTSGTLAITNLGTGTLD
jgi:PKD repeat protein